MENSGTQPNPNDFRSQLHISIAPPLVFLTILALCLLIFTGGMNQSMLNTHMLLMRISLYLLIILVFVINRLHETAGKISLVLSATAYLFYFTLEAQFPELLLLLSLPVGLAAAMLNPRMGLLTAAVGSAGAVILHITAPELINGTHFGLALITLWGTAGLMGAIYAPVYHISDWMLDFYQRALKLRQEAGNIRIELNEALDELLHTNRQLALANEKQLSFRIIAEEAQKTKTAFVAKVSHEFRTPLNMIIGLVNLMIDNPQIYGRALPKAMLEDLIIIQRNCEHLTGMINDVLALSQSESGLLVLHREYIDLKEIIDQALEVVSPLVKKKGLETGCIVTPNLPKVYCDRTRIRQVLLNLVSNAARFTEQGGIYIHVEEQPETLLISVRDTGPGISAEDIARIFDPFCQGSSNATWRDKGGTGLGLTISRQFIELHGGKIWVESQLGIGSTFYFNLPKDQPVAPVTTPRRWISERWSWVAREGQARFSSALLKHPRVALYDPDRMLVDLLSSYKELLEFSTSESVSQLIQDVKETPTNVVLVNGQSLNSVQMVMDTVRQTVRDTPLVGCVVPPQSWKDYSQSIARVLVKPITKKDLTEAIESLGKPIRRILLVDNDEEIIKLYSRMITTGSANGRYEVQTACDGREALEIIRANPPDLVLLDISMPEMDGFQVLAEKEKDPAICQIPVMIVSATDLHTNPLQSQMILATMSNGLRPAKLVECALELSELLIKPDLTPDQARG